MKIPATYPGKLQEGDTQAIARIISVVENEVAGYENYWLICRTTKCP